jgi:acetyltransferase-like isoleucine patch superfamily enzyme
MTAPGPYRDLAPVARVIREAVRAVRRLRLKLIMRSRLSLGRNVAIGHGAHMKPTNLVRIGTNVAIGANFHVETDLTIGDDVLISSRVAVVARDHRFDDPARSVFWSGRLPPGAVVIEGDNLIGFGTIIVGPARIGRGSIVGAGAVVTGDLPPGFICVGVPARPIRARFGNAPASALRGGPG